MDFLNPPTNAGAFPACPLFCPIVDKRYNFQYNIAMKRFKWDELNNVQLQETRGISFEEILEDIKNDQVIEKTEHPNQFRYPNQKVFIINHNNYCYIVPFVEDEDVYFLKTIIPSRKATKKFLKNGG